MKPRVIGLDLSLTATGVADAGPDEQIITDTLRVKSYGDTLEERRYRLNRVFREVWAKVTAYHLPPALVVVEGPSYNSRGAGTWDRAGLWWLVIEQLLTRNLAVVLVPPAVLKKYATGRGNADKTSMAVALQKRAGIELGDDNQVDAWWLAAAGLDHLGHPAIEMPKAQREALAKVTWPEVS